MHATQCDTGRCVIAMAASVGGLKALSVILGGVVPEQFIEARIVLLAQLFGLWVAFIGENLTLRLVRGTWPKLPLNNLDFDNGGK